MISLKKSCQLKLEYLKNLTRLYEQNDSLQAIVTELGISKSAVRQSLIYGGMELKAHSLAN